MINKTIKKKYGDIEFELFISYGDSYKFQKKIISVSVFRLNTNYKPSDEYINGLLRIIEFIKDSPWNLRLYYDKSILFSNHKNLDDETNKWKKILKIALDTQQCELYEYNYIDFKKDKIFHLGLFGTIVRFMPLFNFPFEKSNLVYISDIDTFHYPSYKNIIDPFLNSDAQLLYRSTLCYCNTYYNNITSDMHCPIASMFILKNNKLDYNIFIDYLSQIKNHTGFYKWYTDQYKIDNEIYLAKKIKYDINIDTNNPELNEKKKIILQNNKIKMELLNEVGYGSDEVFLTEFVVKFLLNINIKYVVILKTNPWHLWKNFKYKNNYFNHITPKQHKILNHFFRSLSHNVFNFIKDNHSSNLNSIISSTNPFNVFQNLRHFLHKYKSFFKYIHIDKPLLNCMNMCIRYITSDNPKIKIIRN